MPELDLRTDRRRLLVDLYVYRPGDATDLSGFCARGLLDTGARVSGVGPRVISALGLRSYGKNRLGSATEERLVDYYLFRLGIGRTGDDAAPAWPFLFERVDGFSWSRETEFDVIVGMDILTQCDFTLSRNGHGTLAFG